MKKKRVALKRNSKFLEECDKDESGLHNYSGNMPYSSNHKSKQMKRKYETEDESLVLLSNTVKRNAKRKKTRLIDLNSSLISQDSEDDESEVTSELKNSISDYSQLNTSAGNYESDSSDEVFALESSMNISSDFDEASTKDFSDFDKSDDSEAFYAEMKAELLSDLKRRKSIDRHKNVLISNMLPKNLMVVLLNHPATLTLYKYVSVEVVSGSISICGRKFNAYSGPVKIFSSERTGYIGIKTESFEQVFMNKTFASVNHKLTKIIHDKEKARHIMSKFGNSTVLVVVKGLLFPTKFQFLELYFPHELQFKIEKAKKGIQLSIPKNVGTAIEFGLDAEDMADEVISVIRRSRLNNTHGPIILVYGPKNAGKSSLLQFLVNKALNEFPSVFYLDADPGQTEFTPPGVVSLTQINKPIIGPIFCRKQKPLSMIFTGSASADASPNMYIKSVNKLLSVFKENHGTEALFVNTMGWLKGIGLECLQQILKAAQPAMIGEVVVAESPPSFDYRSHLLGKVKYFQISSPVQDRIPGLTARENRDLAILSYFSKCQVPYLRPISLNDFRPFSVSWDKIPIYIFGRKVPPNRIVEAVNASFVALCRVSESDILVSKIPNFQTTLKEEPMNECLGFGIVRAMDEVKHILHIVTPLQLKELQKVNAIIRGNFELPNSVFLEQNIQGVPFPFTNCMLPDEVDQAKLYRKKVPMRYRKKFAKQ